MRLWLPKVSMQMQVRHCDEILIVYTGERCTPNRRAIEARDAQIADLSTGIQSLRERNDKLHQQLQSIGALPQANVAPSIVGTATAAPRASRKPAKRSQPLRRAKAVKVEEEEEEVDGPGLVPSPSSEEDEPPLKKSRQARKHNPFKLQPATTDHIMVHPPQRLRDPDACRPVAETSQEVQDAVFSLTEICYAAIKLQDSTVQRRQACCMRRLYERAKGGSAIKLQPEACDVCVEKRKPCMQSWPDNAEQSMWFLVPLPAKERMGVDDENALEFYVKS